MAGFEVYVPVCVEFDENGKAIAAHVDHEGAPWMHSTDGSRCVWAPALDLDPKGEEYEWRDAEESELDAAAAFLTKNAASS